MNPIHLFRIYKYMKNRDKEGLKEYSKSMPSKEVSSLRIKNRFLFKVISLIYRFFIYDKKKISKGPTIPLHFLKFYEPIKGNNAVKIYMDKNYEILKNQNNWNILNLLDKDTEGMFLAVHKTPNNRFKGFADTLQWTCYYTASLLKLVEANMYVTEEELAHKELMEKTIKSMLVGIDKCITENAIKRHPLKSISYADQPISQDMVSGLLQLLLTPRPEQFEKFSMLEVIQKKVKKIFLRSDYHLMYPDGTVNSYDLKPNFIYNHIKCFSYIGLRMITREYNNRDKEICKQMMRMLPLEEKSPEKRSVYGLVVAVNSIEAIVNQDRELLLDAIDWLEAEVDSTYEINPELHSVLASLYRMQGYRTKTDFYINNVLGLLSTIALNKEVEKNAAFFKEAADVEEVVGFRPRPPILRQNADWFWQRKGYVRGGVHTLETCNLIEYTNPLARVIDFVYYPD